MFAVAYERQSFMRGSNHRALTWKILVFKRVGCLWEGVTNKRLNCIIRDLKRP